MPASIRRVLYIEDDPALARLVEKALTRRGYDVHHAPDAAAGLALLEEDIVDVIALDHNLPSGTGLDVLAELARREVAPPVVYVTASAETALAVEVLKAGAYDYVPKTVDSEFIELLGRAIDQAIEKARLVRARELAEREVHEARDRAEVLLAEVNHRVANSLSMVAALVRLQANAIADPTAKSALTETQARILAIAGVHRRLYTSHDVRVVEVSEYLGGLTSDLTATMKQSGHRARIRFRADPLTVATDRAVSIGVILTELVTNAVKYAYPGHEDGEIRVTLASGDGNARLAVEDDGVGWDGTGQPQGSGLGTRIVTAMVGSLHGTLSYGTAARGTSISVEFPL